jgi:two-component system cell cycle response regulator
VTGAERRSSEEIVSLARRMGYLQVLRVGMAFVTLGFATFAPTSALGSMPLVAPVTAAYLALATVSEAVRRRLGGRGLPVLFTMLLVDGVYIAWVMYATGGSQSILRFLVFVHIVAVSLAASYRTGLKITLWHSLVFFVVYLLQIEGIIDRVETLPEETFRRQSIWLVTGFWLVAIVTAAFSALNERELRRRRTDLEALTEMGEDLGRLSSPPDIAHVFVERVCASFDFRRGLVLGLTDGRLQVLGTSGLEEGASLEIDDPGAGVTSAWKKRHPLLVKRLDPETDAQLDRLLPGARNVVVVPMFEDAKPLGALVVEHARNRPSRIERRVVTMLEQFAVHTALSLRNAMLLERNQFLAERDPLTGAANRRTFERELKRLMSHADRSGEPITLAMLDVDHFKSFNDRFGHQAGDEILRQVAVALDTECRDFDMPARYGGEEFTVILPMCTTEESVGTAERLRSAVAKIRAPAPVAASAGVATYPDNATDAESLIRAADEALYASKEAGRDRVTASAQRPGRRAVPDRRNQTRTRGKHTHTAGKKSRITKRETSKSSRAGSP